MDALEDKAVDKFFSIIVFCFIILCFNTRFQEGKISSKKYI